MVSFKRARKDGLELTKVGLVTGFGGSVVAGIPSGNAAGLTAFSQGFGSAGSILGAKLVLDSVKTLNPKKSKKSKRGLNNGLF